MIIAIIDPHACRALRPVDAAKRALDLGASFVIARVSGLDLPDRDALLDEWLGATDLAAATVWNAGTTPVLPPGLGGIHLPAAAPDTGIVRERHAPLRLGRSAHNADELERARGADYVLLSPWAATASKPGAAPLGPAAFAALVARAPTTVVALGGVAPADLDAIAAAGAAGAASLGAFCADDQTLARDLCARARGVAWPVAPGIGSAA